VRLLVDGGGYATARTAFEDANQVAAMQYDALVGKLSGYAGMAGDDSTSAEFVAAYDDAAQHTATALADLVEGLASLGRLTEASMANHRNANLASVVGGSVVYDGSSLPTGGYASVLPTAPPSSLGGDSALLSEQENWILDRIEGFVWPNADVARLRDAAHTWRTTCEGLDQLTQYCDAALRGLEPQRSPEIPLAVAAIEEFSGTIGDLATACSGLAASCEDYATQVEAARTRTKALLAEILQMIVEGVVISAAIGMITAGAGAAASASAVVARVIAQDPRFHAKLTALRAGVARAATSLRTTTTAVRTSATKLQKFLDVRLGLPARNEIGSLRLLSHRPAGWLRKHEQFGSHTIERHVGKSDEELLHRMRENPRLPGSSSFPDEGSAENAIDALLTRRASEIRAWARGDDERLFIEGSAGRVVGRFAHRDGSLHDVTSLRVIMVRDGSMSEGFRIVTAYPKP